MLIVLLRAKKKKEKQSASLLYDGKTLNSVVAREGAVGSQSPETDPMWASSLGPHTPGAHSRGPGSTAVRVVFLEVILLDKCEDFAIAAHLLAGCFLRRGH